MNQGLEHAITAVDAYQADYRSVTVPVRTVAFEPGRVQLPDESARLTPEGTASLARHVGAPHTYLQDLPPEVSAGLFTHHFTTGDVGSDRTTFVLQQDTVVGIRPAQVDLQGTEVLTAIREGLGAEDRELETRRFTLQEHTFTLDLVWPGHGIEAVPGDLVEAGLSVNYSFVSAFATNVTGYTHRLACKNGMVVKQCFGCNPGLRTRRLAQGHPRAQELMLDQIRRVASRTWEAVQARLSLLLRLSETHIDVEHAIRSWLRRARLGARTLGDRVLAAWRDDGGADTLWGAVNALTAVGTHDEDISERERRMLQQLSGAIALSSGQRVCPRCLSLIREPHR